ncbi:lipopolysaccharide biosynthesis protein [Leptolyngbyaceae cyanobacterium UHCC 1019]
MKPKSLLKGGFWITFGTFATRFFSLISSLVLARLLSPKEFGVIGIVYVFWSFFTLFTQDTAGAFIIYKGVEDPHFLNAAYTVSLSIGLIFAFIMVAVSPLVGNFFNEPSVTQLLIAFSLNIVLSSLYYVYTGVMTRQMQYRELANISLISGVARLLSTIISAVLGLSYWSFAIGDTTGWITGCILAKHYSGRRYRIKLLPEVRDEVVSYCLATVKSNLGFYANANLDNFAVGKFLGSAMLGYYSLAYQLTMALSTVFNSVISQLGMPIFAQLSDDKQQEDVLYKVVEQIAFLTAPLYALFFLIINENSIALIFGSKWIPIATIIPWLLVFAYFRVINTPLNNMLSAKGLPKVNAKVNLHIAPIAVIGFVVGAHTGGILGVSIAVALILGIGWTLYWWWMGCKVLGWSLKKFLIPCFTPTFITIPALALSFYLPFVFRPILFTLIYFVGVYVISPSQFCKYRVLATQAKDWIISKRAGNSS